MKFKAYLLLAPLILSLGSVFGNYCDPCYGDCSCSNNTVFVDWLYWNTRNCGLDYLWPQDPGSVCKDGGTSGDFQAVYDFFPEKTVGRGKPKSVNPCYTSGVRVGFNHTCDCWDYGFKYTYYQQCKSDSCHLPNVGHTGTEMVDGNTCNCLESNYVPSRQHPGQMGFVQGNNVGFAKSNYELHYHLVELLAGRRWDMGCRNYFKMYGGVQLAFIDQCLRTRYDGTSIITEVVSGQLECPQDRQNKVHEKCDLCAYGLYTGSEAHVNLCGDFGVFGRASLGALVGSFDRKFFEEEVNAPWVHDAIFGNYCYVDVHDCIHCIVTHLEVAAGGEYNCTCGCYDLGLQIGYEIHSWSNMVGFLAFVSDHEHGAISRSSDGLGFDGLYIRANIGF